MKKTIFALLVLSLVLVACSDKKKSVDYSSSEHSSYVTEEKLVKSDTVLTQQPEKKPTSTQNISSYHSHSAKDKQLDNMRGFDPASEDDMDDNGLQRYFDANDDEAWD